jgi:hypothetical protein
MVQKEKSTNKRRFGHWVRIAVMCLSGGFIYPNVMTEDDDIVTEAHDKNTKVNKQ